MCSFFHVSLLPLLLVLQVYAIRVSGFKTAFRIASVRLHFRIRAEYATKSVASIIQPPHGEAIVDPAAITRSLRSKDVGFVAMGFTTGHQKEMAVDEYGIAYVDMNKSGRLEIPQGKDGLIATNSLAGCTGVAGFAKRLDGSIATFVSHYDAMTQSSLLTGEDSPVNKDLYSFRYQAGQEGLASPIYYLVAYPNGEHSNPDYGKRNGAFKNWRYLDQINVTANQLGNDSEVLLLPYDEGLGHSLASGKVNDHEGIFWDGVPVDFGSYLRNQTAATSV